MPASFTVLKSDGELAGGATVVVVPVPLGPNDPLYYFMFHGDVRVDVSKWSSGTTDAAGRCSLVLPDRELSIVAFSDDGWARVPRSALPADGKITLAPWGKVTGQLIIGGKPAADQTIRIENNLDWPAGNVMTDVCVRTDAAGRFSADRVVPGTISVGQFVKSDGTPGAWNSGGSSQRGQRFDLKPGEARDVKLGEAGRTVVGTVELPADTDKHGMTTSGQIVHWEPRPEWPMPPEIYNGTVDQRRAWATEFYKTDAYAELLEAFKKADAATREYTVEWTDDKQFRIDDLPPGDYELTVQNSRIKERTADTRDYIADTLKFVVPPLSNGQKEEPIRLGPVKMYQPQEAAVGKPAPDFALPTLDGKTVRLSDYRGRFVLLEFWGAGCGPCLAEIANVREVYSAFGGEKNFAILGISADTTMAKAQAYVKAQKIPWTQAWIDDASRDRVNEHYVNGFPQFWLIGPDGVVVCNGMRGAAIKEAVAKALGK